MADLIDFKTGKPINKNNTGGQNPPPPTFPNGPNLPQIPYRITLVDKVTGGEVIHEKRGHIVVTASNIVLFDANQEMIWGIPNDDFVISFERLDEEIEDADAELVEAIWEDNSTDGA